MPCPRTKAVDPAKLALKPWAKLTPLPFKLFFPYCVLSQCKNLTNKHVNIY
jgi:hypothetical protein